MHLDPMFLGIYLCESDINFWRKWSDSSDTAVCPISTLYYAKSDRQIFAAQKSLYRVLLLYEADLKCSI